MDTRDGRIYTLDDVIPESVRPFLKPIERDLTALEMKRMRIGRNDPCGCGSGKKFKKCCMMKIERGEA